jgi:hypothetical protein
VLLLAAGCSKTVKDAPRRESAHGDAAIAATVPIDAAAPALPSKTYADLATALASTIPADARVVGFGEVHMRTDRKQVKSALSRFTSEGLPAIQDKLSDLIIETWIVDPKCGQKAQTATAKVEMTVRRPQETKSEIAVLADAAKAAKIQPHAMRLTCADYDKIAPQAGDASPTAMLDLTTTELTRISREAVTYRDNHGEKRPWIGLYGGALHNDRFPASGLEQWSYAKAADDASKNHFVEVDLIVPELAEADEGLKKQDWYPVVQQADDKIHVWQRGERSFVFILPRTPSAPPAPAEPIPAKTGPEAGGQ